MIDSRVRSPLRKLNICSGNKAFLRFPIVESRAGLLTALRIMSIMGERFFSPPEEALHCGSRLEALHALLLIAPRRRRRRRATIALIAIGARITVRSFRAPGRRIHAHLHIRAAEKSRRAVRALVTAFSAPARPLRCITLLVVVALAVFVNRVFVLARVAIRTVRSASRRIHAHLPVRAAEEPLRALQAGGARLAAALLPIGGRGLWRRGLLAFVAV